MEQINELPDPDEHLPAAKGVLDILKFSAEDAIRDMTVDQYLDMFKDISPITETYGGNEKDFFTHQQTYLDEKELAEHKFRESTSGSKSLDDFVTTQNNEDIYEQYRA